MPSPHTGLPLTHGMPFLFYKPLYPNKTPTNKSDLYPVSYILYPVSCILHPREVSASGRLLLLLALAAAAAAVSAQRRDFRTPRGEPRTSRRRRASGLRPCLRAWNRWQCMREKRRATQDNARQAAAAHGQHQRDPHASSMCTIGFGTSINSASPLLGHRRRWRL